MNVERMSSVLAAFARENSIINIRAGEETLSFEECGDPGMGMMAAYKHCQILSEYLPEEIRSCFERVKLKEGGPMSLYGDEIDYSDTDQSEMPCAYIVLSMMMTSLTMLNERHFDVLAISENNAPLLWGNSNLSYLDRFLLDASKRKAAVSRSGKNRKTENDPEVDKSGSNLY